MFFRVGHFIPSLSVTAVFLHSREGQVSIWEEQDESVSKGGRESHFQTAGSVVTHT